jgi:periplasmic protein TonB
VARVITNALRESQQNAKDSANSKNGIRRAMRYDMRKQSVLYSFCIHLAIVTLLLLTATFTGFTSNTRRVVTRLEAPSPHLTAPKIRTPLAGGASGGGHMNPLPPERGAIPQVAKIFIPPMPRPKDSPQIALPTGLEDMPQIATDMPIGVPTGIAGTGSMGPGKNGAGGNGTDGVGRGPGGKGGTGSGPGGDYRPQRLSALPQLLWKTEPEYSEEARKARHQGSVLLALEIDSEGRPRNIRVVQSLGLGLDERAVAAVLQWRFKPGLLNGRPVNAPIRVEVSFRLL